MYKTKLIPNYCRLCLNRQHCDFNFQYEIRNNGHHGQCPHFVLTVSKLSTEQLKRFEQFYEQHQKSWNRALEINFAESVVESASYR